MNTHFLLPGEMAWQREPTAITTILGSCVAVCLHDRTRGHGGMNHYMIGDNLAAAGMTPGKIGDSAIAGLIRLAEMAGSARRDLSASIHGGGAVIGHLGGIGNVGERNIQVARERLAAAGIPIRHSEVGGTQGRRIILRTDSGEVETHLVPSAAPLPATAAAPAAVSGRGRRVLVIDDSATVRGLLRQAIDGQDGFQVVGEACDPFQAREAILQLDPDVLCLDIIMPNMDGLTFLKRIMQYRPIPTVIVSTIAKAGSAIYKNAMDAGAVAAIDKDALALYQGIDQARRALLAVLRQAAARVR